MVVNERMKRTKRKTTMTTAKETAMMQAMTMVAKMINE